MNATFSGSLGNIVTFLQTHGVPMHSSSKKEGHTGSIISVSVLHASLATIEI